MAGAEPATYLEVGTKREALPTLQGALFVRSTVMPQTTSPEAASPITLLSALVFERWARRPRHALPKGICYSSWLRSRPLKTMAPATSTAMPSSAPGINSTAAKEPAGDVAEKLFRVTAVVCSQSRAGP